MVALMLAMPAFSDDSSAAPGVTLTVGNPILFQSDNLSAPEWRIFYDEGNPYGAEINLTTIDMTTVDYIVISMSWLDEWDTCWGMNPKPAFYSIASDYGDGELEIRRSNFVNTNDWNTTTHIMFDSSGTGTLLGAGVIVYGFPEYATIQSALNVANDGDTIHVLYGYYPGALNADKAIDIIGTQAEIWMTGGTLRVNNIDVAYITLDVSTLTADTITIADTLTIRGGATVTCGQVNADQIQMLQQSFLYADTINVNLLRMQQTANVTANETVTTELIMSDTTVLTTQNLTASIMNISEGATLTILYVPPPPTAGELGLVVLVMLITIVVAVRVFPIIDEEYMGTINTVLGACMIVTILTLLF